MIQKSPITRSRFVPRGTAGVFVRLLTWIERMTVALGLKHTTSMPRVLRDVGITFQTRDDSL